MLATSAHNASALASTAAKVFKLPVVGDANETEGLENTRNVINRKGVYPEQK
jgi:hypothetical protein